jgi:hypothetical protein
MTMIVAVRSIASSGSASVQARGAVNHFSRRPSRNGRVIERAATAVFNFHRRRRHGAERRAG